MFNHLDQRNRTDSKLRIGGVRASYLEKLEQDLEVSKDCLNKCKKGSDKHKFYKEHIEWLESEIETLDN